VLGKGDVFRFHFIGDTVAFYPQTQKLQPPGATSQPTPQESTAQ